MRVRVGALRAVSTVTLLGMALAVAVVPASAQVSGSGDVGHPNPAQATAASASSASGAITGVVDGAGGRPLTGACVIATGPGGSSTLAVTRSDGRYVLGDLLAGGYTLHYSPCAAGGQYVDQWSGGAFQPGRAATVAVARGVSRALAPVTLGTAVPGVPAALPPATAKAIAATATLGGPAGTALANQATSAVQPASGAKTGAIGGTVTGGGKPLKGICVEAYGPSFNHTVTSKAGKFLIAKLRPGRYFVFYSTRFCAKNSGNWLPQYYKNVNGPVIRKSPTRVPVKAGQTTTGIDAALQLGGQISGTVRSATGKTLSHVCALAVDETKHFYLESYTISGKDGGYALHSLFPGKYKVLFLPRDCGGTGNYIPQWWRKSQDEKHAVRIAITRGLIVRKVDAALAPGAIINGVVRATNSHGALLSHICVDVLPTGRESSQPTYAFTRTGADGSYHVVGLETGKYEIFFLRECGSTANVLPIRRTLSVVAGHTTSGFDAFLPPGAIITGTVTGPHGSPAKGVCVSASGRGFGAVTTKPDGTYSIVALPTSHYTVEFSGGCGNKGSYAPQYYAGQDNAGSASKVAAVAGRTTASINAAMKPGGTITGVVTDSSGKPVGQVCVQIQTPSVSEFGYPFDFSFTSKAGVYTASNLVPGLYAVNFNCFLEHNLTSQWFRGQAGSGTAGFVSAPAGVVTTGISAVLRSGGFVTGVVTKNAGKPIPNLCVQLVPVGSPAQSQFFFIRRNLNFTNNHGFYRVGPVAAGKYDVQFSCFASRWSDQWYRGSSTRATATPVRVANRVTTTGINATLVPSTTISGVVTAGANQPEARVCVTADDTVDGVSGQALTNSHGHYSVGGLSTGTYQMTFFDCNFARHHTALGTATSSGLVKVTAPQAVTGVNVKLSPAGAISGIVRGGPGVTLQAGACVAAVPVSPGGALESVVTTDNGGYRMTRMAPGTYQVYFGDPFCFFAGGNYAPQWFKDQASQASATTVTVTAGHDASGIIATLGADGAITGTVTSHPHAPVAGECVTATPVDPVPDPVTGSVLHPVIGVTASDGRYSLVGLLPGKYTVEFSAGCGNAGFRPQWWPHASSASGAVNITVAANGTVTGIDAHLGHGG